MKTKPERQYDIFLVKGEDPTPPPGSHLLTTFDPVLGGHWAIQYAALVTTVGHPELGSMAVGSWTNTGM